MFTLAVIIIITLLICLTALAETDNGGIGFWVLVTVLAICHFWLYRGCLSPFGGYAVSNPGILIFGVIGYIVLGVLWSFFRWYIYLLDYKKLWPKADVHDAAGISPSYNKSRLISWMAYWPLSACWFIMHKPFTRLYNWIFDKVSATYQQIADKVFKAQ